MKKILFIFIVIVPFLQVCSAKNGSNIDQQTKRPNVLLIYTDDVGYGDIGIYGGEIPTPNIDALAESGIQFTNAYASSATCTPSRFSLLTGEYSWRKPGRGVAPGDAPALIQPGKETLPSVMKRAGYRTGVIGKWHLGLGGDEGPDWNGKITPGPLEIGFDYSFIIPATGDRVPTVFVENHHIVGLDPDDPIEVSFSEKIGDRPTGKEHPEQLKMMWTQGHNHSIINGISRIGYMKGGESALWKDEDFAGTFVKKAQSFIQNRDAKDPFFLFFSTHDIHVPRVPHERFAGTTGHGPRGDVIAQLDWTVGALMDYLEQEDLRDNTIVIFSSDNGPVLDDGYADEAAEKLGLHDPFSNLRGGKYSAFEAGTKVPFIISWPAEIPPGQTSEALFSQVDLLASFAAFNKTGFDASEAMDSQNHWDVLMGKTTQGRAAIVQEAIGRTLSYVTKDGYKYISPSNRGPLISWGVNIETGFAPAPQLYNLNEDPQEIRNIAEKHPELVSQLEKELNKIINKQ
ncbi:sulfatase-like hydrolase/transferase [Marinilabilia rubra]|uniref:Arylsulfatase n=1 Tax=Marinilabilia rubra TaxID=2162893 RepID=A0A2U2BBG4_9BACT|nr:sulfatase-like hydrolase/transferase [Marinilabilia rubra]PWE00399.1 arylsulfatase [Marinilabilia rubra]